MANLEIIPEEKTDVTILHLKGFLDAYTFQEFENKLKELVDDEKIKIIVAMDELDYISSAGLGVFMSVIGQIRAKGGDVKLTQLNSKVFKVFELLGFTKLFQTFDNIEEAVDNFK
ncbi:STAS domain-containing protein [Candidatus Calescamantes bacterium]|nr:STAS domain-containing protein [bacterium]MCK5223302.1 STAS domain-containing protein [Candidatus Calescamantes bacterium]MCK5398536.1 STAS domain-containing protein [bacterium]MCK5598054.1 STAS domain-containing protein [bacterium]